MNPNEFFTTHLFLFPSNALESLSCTHTETFGSFGSRRHGHWVPRPAKSQCPMNWLHSSSTSLPREDQWESKANVSRGRERHMHVSNTGGCPPKKRQSWSGEMMINRWLYEGPILRPACTWVWSRDRMEAQRTSISFIIPNRECGCNRLFFGKSLIEIKWILGQNLQETTMLTWNIGPRCFLF